MLEKLHTENLEVLNAKRSALIKELTSSEHYEATPTVWYGCHDPFDVPIAKCDTCSSQAEVLRVTTGQNKQRWIVSCTTCDKQTRHPQKDIWMAALMWNGVNLRSQYYKDLPLFGLTHMSTQEAREKVSRVRHNLVLRITLCDVDRAIADAGSSFTKPGFMYKQRLDAYLKWAMHAHKLIKLEKDRDAEAVDSLAEAHAPHLHFEG